MSNRISKQQEAVVSAVSATICQDSACLYTGMCEGCAEKGVVVHRTLADDGLLAPDLPDPTIYDGLVEWDTPRGYVNVENGVIVAAYDHRAAPSAAANTLIVDDRDAARAIGLALLAAADRVEASRDVA